MTAGLQSVELLQVIGLCSGAALFVEVLLWLWAFRSDSFRSLRVSATLSMPPFSS